MQWVEIILENEGYNLLEEIRMKLGVEELRIWVQSWLHAQISAESYELYVVSLSLSLFLLTLLPL